MTDSNITDMHPDFLTALTTKIIDAKPDAYQALVVKDPTPDFARKLLTSVKPEQLLTLPIQNAAEATAMLGGLWLWHDGLAECHNLVQELIGPTGAFWHAIMHRREGDFSNAKYWYSRCTGHRTLRLISTLAMDAIGGHSKDKSLLQIAAGEYRPEALVDLVEEITENPSDPRRAAAVRLQQVEWEALFHHCAYEATGAKGGMI